jgi:hypothetical protein
VIHTILWVNSIGFYGFGRLRKKYFLLIFEDVQTIRGLNKLWIFTKRKIPISRQDGDLKHLSR